MYWTNGGWWMMGLGWIVPTDLDEPMLSDSRLTLKSRLPLGVRRKPFLKGHP
jgi:hypothetical protein